MHTQAPHRRRGGRLVDAVIVGLILVTWLTLVGRLTSGRRMVLWDTFRDMAWAENIRAGHVWDDPTHLGHPYWYAPGNPLLFGGLSRITGLSVIDLYGYSPLWFNGLLPVILYVLMRAFLDRTTSLVAVLTVFLGSFTWLTHATSAIPGLQGVALNLVALFAWHRCCTADDARPRTAWGWTLLTGVLLALSAWYHPLCAMVLAGSIFLHAAALAPPGSRRVLVLRMAVIALVAALLAAPLIRHMLALQVQNAAMLRYFAEEVVDPAYYAQAQTPLVVLAGLAGVGFILREHPHAGWIVGYLLVGLVGLLPALAAQHTNWDIPFLLPHEFLWHAQLALGLCAALGIAGFGRYLVAPQGRHGRRVALQTTSTVLLAAVAVAPGLGGLSQADKYLIDLEPLLDHTRELRTWIHENTALKDVFVCPPDAGYRVVAGLTGRRCVAVSPLHTNPAADMQRRQDDTKAMLEAESPHILFSLARRYTVRYLLLVTEPGDTSAVVQPDCATWPGVELVFVSTDGTSAVYRIDPHTATPWPTAESEPR